MKTKTIIVDDLEKSLEDSLREDAREKVEVFHKNNEVFAKCGNKILHLEGKLPVGLEGKITKFDETGSMAFVETEYGEAMVNVDCGWDLRLKAGDEIQLEDADIYIQNGRIVTLVKGELWLNGIYIKANI